MSAVKVVARFRPLNELEIAQSGEQQGVSLQGFDTVCLDADQSFTFDRVFAGDARQKDVFDYSIKSTVDDVLNGYNGTVFAYGQTGSGKTFTMMGSNIDDHELKGVVPRITEQVFRSILEGANNIEYTVKVSYMEIYMERIRDLLNPQNDNLPIHEDKARGVYVKDLLEIYVSSVEDVYEVMKRGSNARATASTTMNAESSRSHSIFVITISQKNVETGSVRSGAMYLVDLAGSEKVGKTGASGQTLEEAKKINRSLSALGNVINSLTDGKSTHVPYRDSKLTRILQESLGGNSRTTLIINCSLSLYNEAETLSTLRFGWRAKTIKNKARINVELSPAELKNLLKDSKAKVLHLQDYVVLIEGELSTWRSGQTVPDAERVKCRPTSRSVLETLEVMPNTPRPSSPFPATPLSVDERDEFLRRENELQDIIADNERKDENKNRQLAAVQDDISSLKAQHLQSTRANESLVVELDDVKLRLERIMFENKEAQITIDGLKEANEELSLEAENVKAELMHVPTNEPTSDLDQTKILVKRIRELESKTSPPDYQLVKRQKEQAEVRLTELEVDYLSLLHATNSDDTKNASPALKQMADFDTVKRSLMRDLQNKCERVVELEIQLDESREQYNSVLRTNGNRSQQKKMAFLERNLEQLTSVQRHLVEQNSSLKKEVAIAERKLIARNERIEELEQQVHEATQNINQKSRYMEEQLVLLKQRLEEGSSKWGFFCATNYRSTSNQWH